MPERPEGCLAQASPGRGRALGIDELPVAVLLRARTSCLQEQFLQ